MASLEKSGRPGDVDRKTGRALEWLNERSTAIAALSDEALGTGIVVRTGTDAFTTRTIVAPAAGITVTNPGGVAGDITLVLANDLAAVENLGGTGIAVRSAGNTWVQRSIAAGTGISVSNGDGVSGNPTVSLTSQGPTVLVDFYSSVLNSGTSETDLFSHTLTAGRLSANGQKILAQYGGNLSASSAPIIKVYFGGTQIFSTGTLGIGGATAYWSVSVMLIRVSSSAVRYDVSLIIQLESPEVYNVVGELSGLTLSNSNVIKITGQSGAGGEIAAVCGFVEWKPAA